MVLRLRFVPVDEIIDFLMHPDLLVILFVSLLVQSFRRVEHTVVSFDVFNSIGR